jgi:hypothetical protein
MTSIINAKNNYIILTNNIIDTSNGGSLLYIKTNISDLSNNNTDISWQKLLQRLDNSNNTYKNRILLSGKIINNNGATTSTSCCLISQNNIKNNMKFIFDSSNNKNGKILFVKNLNTYDNSYNYLFNDLSNTFFGKNNINPYNIYNSLTTNNDTSYNRYRFHLNYYFSNSDMYQINIRDYLYSKYSNTTQSDYANIKYTITSISNDFSFINTTIDSSSVINFEQSNFTRPLIDNASRSSTTIFTTDNSFTKLEQNTLYPINRNILSYNKLTLDFKHVNYYDFSSTYTSSSINNINTISTFLIKTNNLNIIQNIKKNSKIIFGLKNIYLQNVKVLDYSSNLYHRTISFNNQNKILKRDFSNTVFLGLGNRLTGITQHDIYNHAHFSTNSKQKSIITLKKNINTNNINTNFKLKSIIPNLNKYYLLDICLNYIKTNNSHNINNTMNYNIILYNNIKTQLGKVFNINLTTYFNALTNNNFKNSFKNLAKINKISNICGEIYSISYEQINSAINVKFKNFIRDSDVNDFTITNDDEIKLLNIKQLRDDDKNNNILLTSPTNYDLRFNYNKIFNIFNELDIYLNGASLNLTSTNYAFEILNFYSIRFANFVITGGASDFTNVDCVYIYHDPINDPDERFRYPNNNIEIKFDSTIDTLSKAIQQYRGTGARTSTTNAAFIPAKNGSNLSRKMIQGLVGLNNIPKLLSIEPYDPNFINGRGFINQYQINDTCITNNCDKVAVKQNAIKHDSVKNNRIYSSNSLKKQNFANIVKSNSRNKLSQDCINKNTTLNNVVTINNTINDPNCTNIKKTPFTVIFSKGKGKFL